ncbi:putative membrane protein [Secundilactobacillus oryzae JCM 18671]|uniref:Putative membrane protein n=1 Tax=Secundilactobacillus oryzae JCM 18671 TaxID=1291743 RepID=A0A081BG35_9LACO|nr:Bax inhibitor-1/YccA family protein [Secundilactobacillus oryzae]GAK47003.1 putative membrane protein [Secundilactobacillus oryzae JCM 18671]
MNNYDGTGRRIVNADAGLNAFMTRMFAWMGLAVLVSAGSAYAVTEFFPSVMAMFNGGGIWIPLIAMFVFPFLISSQSMKNSGLSLVLLMIYAALMGAVFSFYTLIYTSTTIVSAFIASAAVFLVMAFIGATTKRDLTRVGTQAVAALIALIVINLLNAFIFKSSMISLVFSFIAVIIFTILTATDTNKMKQIYMQNSGQISVSGLAVMGALQLYLDFVNLFLSLVQIFGAFGGSRD